MPLDDYILHEKLGEGTFGLVRRATHIATGNIVAIKTVKNLIDEEGIPGTTLREVSALKELNHPNIVDITDVCMGNHDISIVMPYCETDLRKLIGQGMSSDNIRMYSRQLCRGVANMHSRRWMHRDLKPQNILIKNSVLKIGDLGLNRAFLIPMRAYTLEVMTRWYRCPELFLGADKYGCEVDMWSCGCIIGEMCWGNALFPGDSEIDTLFKIFRLLGTPSKDLWAEAMAMKHFCADFPKYDRKDLGTAFAKIGPDGVALLSRLLEYVPSSRITAQEALRLPYLLEDM